MVTLIILVFVTLAVIVAMLVSYSSRLDRLHIRADAAWAGLDAALARRSVVVRSMSGMTQLRALAEKAEAASRAEREGVENELTMTLSTVPRSALPVEISVELLESEQRILLARRVFNDAVRDTLALRRRHLVRWLHLAGTAPFPQYFEITEDFEVVVVPRDRSSARILLVDEQNRILLFRGHDPANPDDVYWFTPGGGVEGDETLEQAATRELLEETGIAIAETDLVGPVWYRESELSFAGELLASKEWFYLVRVDTDVITTDGFTDLEKATVHKHHWWTFPELLANPEPIYPAELPDRLPDLARWDGFLVVVE